MPFAIIISSYVNFKNIFLVSFVLYAQTDTHTHTSYRWKHTPKTYILYLFVYFRQFQVECRVYTYFSVWWRTSQSVGSVSSSFWVVEMWLKGAQGGFTYSVLLWMWNDNHAGWWGCEVELEAVTLFVLYQQHHNAGSSYERIYIFVFILFQINTYHTHVCT